MQKDKSSGSGVKKRTLSPALLVTLLILALTILFFFPKERVVGGLRGGPISPGETAYREDYTCTGVAYDFCPNWPDYGCDYLCFGIVSNRSCTLESYEVERGVTRVPAACEGPARPGWGFPGP
jgi:hypothetical protein